MQRVQSTGQEKPSQLRQQKELVYAKKEFLALFERHAKEFKTPNLAGTISDEEIIGALFASHVMDPECSKDIAKGKSDEGIIRDIRRGNKQQGGPQQQRGNQNYQQRKPRRIFADFVAAESSEDAWYYVDETQNIQGPFASKEMDEWYQQGYFNEGLLIRNGENSAFLALKDFVSLMSSRGGGGNKPHHGQHQHQQPQQQQQHDQAGRYNPKKSPVKDPESMVIKRGFRHEGGAEHNEKTEGGGMQRGGHPRHESHHEGNMSRREGREDHEEKRDPIADLQNQLGLEITKAVSAHAERQQQSQHAQNERRNKKKEEHPKKEQHQNKPQQAKKQHPEEKKTSLDDLPLATRESEADLKNSSGNDLKDQTEYEAKKKKNKQYKKCFVEKGSETNLPGPGSQEYPPGDKGNRPDENQSKNSLNLAETEKVAPPQPNRAGSNEEVEDEDDEYITVEKKPSKKQRAKQDKQREKRHEQPEKEPLKVEKHTGDPAGDKGATKRQKPYVAAYVAKDAGSTKDLSEKPAPIASSPPNPAGSKEVKQEAQKQERKKPAKNMYYQVKNTSETWDTEHGTGHEGGNQSNQFDFPTLSEGIKQKKPEPQKVDYLTNEKRNEWDDTKTESPSQQKKVAGFPSLPN